MATEPTEPGTPSPPPPRPPARRWPRRALWAVAGLLLLPFLLVALFLAVLFSPPGERWVEGQALLRVDAALAGSLTAKELELSWEELSLTGVELRTPEGERVLQVERLSVKWQPWALFQRRVQLEAVTVERPALFLRQDARGLNLSRALAPAEEEPEPPSGGGGFPLTVAVESLALTDGRLEFVRVEPGPQGDLEHPLLLEALKAQGKVRYEGPTSTVDAQLQLGGALRRPHEAPLSVDAALEGPLDSVAGHLLARLGALELDARARRTDDGQGYAVELNRALLPPAELRALLPGYPLQVPVELSGAAQSESGGGRLGFSLQGSAGSARLTARGGVDLLRLRATGVRLELGGVDLSQLLEDGPRSQLELALEAEGGGTSLEDLEGTLSLTVPASQVEGRTVGPIRLALRAEGGRFVADALEAELPGVSLHAQGQGTPQTLELSGTLDAKDLSALSRSLRGVVDGADFAGAGRLRFTLRGPPRGPALGLEGAFSSLRVGDSALQALSLEASLPDVRRPLDADATLRVGLLRVGGRELRDLSGQLTTRGRALTLELSTKGLAELSLRAGGTVDPDGEGLTLDTLELRYPELTWALASPTRLTFGGGEVKLEPATLRADDQALSVSVLSTPRRLDTRLELRGLDLSRLPRAFVPPSLGLGGRLHLQARVHGPSSRPRVEGTVRLEDGRVQGCAPIGLQARAEYEHDRLTVEGRGQALSAPFELTANLPLQALERGRREPVSAVLTVAESELGPLAAAFGVKQPVRGMGAVALTVSGEADAPKVELRVTTKAVQVEDSPPADVKLTVQSLTQGGLALRVDLEALQGRAWALVKTPTELGALLRSPPDLEGLRALPMTLEAELERLPIEALTQAGLRASSTRGRVSMRAALEGTAKAPRGTVRAQVDGYTPTTAVPPLDAVLQVELGGAGVVAKLDATRSGQRLVALEAKVGATLAELVSTARLEAVPLELEGKVGPLPLAALQPPPEEGEEPLRGELRATVKADGTLTAPRMDVKASVDGLGLGPLAVGEVELGYGYKDARSTLELRLASARGGQLRLSAQLLQALSLPALTKGFDLRKAPVKARLEAEKFDLGFLSGLSPAVRNIGGTLQANATAEGPLAAPAVRGRVEWRNGVLGLQGYGRYEGIQLLVQGTEDALTLDELTVRAQKGKLELSAQAKRVGDRFVVSGKGRMDEFPLIQEDQLRAIVSLRSTLQGEVAQQLVNITDLSIPEARITLPEVRAKDLQPLERPDDIVLVRNGVPLYRQKKDETLPQAQAGSGGAGSSVGPPEPTRTAPAFWRYVVLVHAPRNLWVRGTDVQAELGLSDDFRVEVAERTALFGTVRVIRGQVDALGRSFEIQRDSQVKFTGPPLAPYINVTGVYVNEREEVTVYLNVRGQGREITLKPTSNPALSESEIYTLLATGRRTLKQGSGASIDTNQAASVVGSLAANQVRRLISDKLPLDVVSIEAGQEGLQGTRLEFGTYLGDQVYLGYQRQVGADLARGENSNAVRLEYQITPRWSLETEYGDAKAGGADLIWSRDY